MHDRMAAAVKALGVCALAAVAVAAATAATPRLAPQVSGKDVVTGRHASLSQFAGRPVVVFLWASWCGGCVQEAPALVRFERRHPSVAFLGIDNDQSRGRGRYFARQHRLPGYSIFDPT